MSNHMKFCGCKSCRWGMHNKRRMEVLVRRTVRRFRHATKAALARGEEPDKVTTVPYTF
jgi:hypothetical protein